MIKKITRVTTLILLFLPMIAAAHFFIFPQETRCILIELADFKKQQNIYYRNNVPGPIIQQLSKIKAAAEQKVNAFWNDPGSINYKLIYCQEASDYKNYGREGAPAVANLKVGAYVVIPKNMFDADVLAHEISHTVLYRKIGWWKMHVDIPTWFDEGLAMQVDGRYYYSIDTLLKKQAAGIILPDVTQMNTPEKFHHGSPEQIMLNYSTAKFVIHEWLVKHSVNAFVESINRGYGFSRSFNMNK